MLVIPDISHDAPKPAYSQNISAPLFRADSRFSRTSNAPPSPKERPSLLLENGLQYSVDNVLKESNPANK